MSYPDSACMYRTQKVSLKHSEQLRQRWWLDNNMIIPWWLTDHITANHSNYLVCDKTIHLMSWEKSGKTATQLLQCPRN